MKKILKCLLILTIVASFMPNADAKTQRSLERKYIKSLRAGCEDVQIKNPSTAAWLGLLPGGGSFYTGQMGLGVLDLLFWPISPIWDIPLAQKKAYEINKEETIYLCEDEGKI